MADENLYRVRAERGEVQIGTWVNLIRTPSVLMLLRAAGLDFARIIRAMLRDDQLAKGNGILSTIDNALRLVSPLIGTALYVWVGPQAVVVLTAGCFAVAAAMSSTSRLGSPPQNAIVPPTSSVTACATRASTCASGRNMNMTG